MKILVSSDIHVHAGILPEVLDIARQNKVDVIVIPGDIVPKDIYYGNGYIESQRAYLRDIFLPKFEEFKATEQTKDIKIYLDMGNDDFIANRPILEAHNGKEFNLLHMERHEITEDVDILGYMCVPVTPFGIKDWEKIDTKKHKWAPLQVPTTRGWFTSSGEVRSGEIDVGSDDTIETDMKELSKMVRKKFIFVSHTPPYNTNLDMLSNGWHVGSLAVRKFIEKWGKKKMMVASFHGHIHESPYISNNVMEIIADVKCYNYGQIGQKTKYGFFEI